MSSARKSLPESRKRPRKEYELDSYVLETLEGEYGSEEDRKRSRKNIGEKQFESKKGEQEEVEHEIDKLTIEEQYKLIAQLRQTLGFFETKVELLERKSKALEGLVEILDRPNRQGGKR